MKVYSDFWCNGAPLTLELWQAKDAADLDLDVWSKLPQSVRNLLERATYGETLAEPIVFNNTFPGKLIIKKTAKVAA